MNVNIRGYPPSGWNYRPPNHFNGQQPRNVYMPPPPQTQSQFPPSNQFRQPLPPPIHPQMRLPPPLHTQLPFPPPNQLPLPYQQRPMYPMPPLPPRQQFYPHPYPPYFPQPPQWGGQHFVRMPPWNGIPNNYSNPMNPQGMQNQMQNSQQVETSVAQAKHSVLKMSVENAHLEKRVVQSSDHKDNSKLEDSLNSSATSDLGTSINSSSEFDKSSSEITGTDTAAATSENGASKKVTENNLGSLKKVDFESFTEIGKELQIMKSKLEDSQNSSSINTSKFGKSAFEITASENNEKKMTGLKKADLDNFTDIAKELQIMKSKFETKRNQDIDLTVESPIKSIGVREKTRKPAKKTVELSIDLTVESDDSDDPSEETNDVPETFNMDVHQYRLQHHSDTNNSKNKNPDSPQNEPIKLHNLPGVTLQKVSDDNDTNIRTDNSIITSVMKNDSAQSLINKSVNDTDWVEDEDCLPAGWKKKEQKSSNSNNGILNRIYKTPNNKILKSGSEVIAFMRSSNSCSMLDVKKFMNSRKRSRQQSKGHPIVNNKTEMNKRRKVESELMLQTKNNQDIIENQNIQEHDTKGETLNSISSDHEIMKNPPTHVEVSRSTINSYIHDLPEEVVAKNMSVHEEREEICVEKKGEEICTEKEGEEICTEYEIEQSNSLENELVQTNEINNSVQPEIISTFKGDENLLIEQRFDKNLEHTGQVNAVDTHLNEEHYLSENQIENIPVIIASFEEEMVSLEQEVICKDNSEMVNWQDVDFEYEVISNENLSKNTMDPEYEHEDAKNDSEENGSTESETMVTENEELIEYSEYETMIFRNNYDNVANDTENEFQSFEVSENSAGVSFNKVEDISDDHIEIVSENLPQPIEYKMVDSENKSESIENGDEIPFISEDDIEVIRDLEELSEYKTIDSEKEYETIELIDVTENKCEQGIDDHYSPETIENEYKSIEYGNDQDSSEIIEYNTMDIENESVELNENGVAITENINDLLSNDQSSLVSEKDDEVARNRYEYIETASENIAEVVETMDSKNDFELSENDVGGESSPELVEFVSKDSEKDFELNENDIDVLSECSPEVVELEPMDSEKNLELSENDIDVVGESSPEVENLSEVVECETMGIERDCELNENDIDVVGLCSPEVVELETMDNEGDFELNDIDVVSESSPKVDEFEPMNRTKDFELHENDIDVVGESSSEVVEFEHMHSENDFELHENDNYGIGESSSEVVELKPIDSEKGFELHKNDIDVVGLSSPEVVELETMDNEGDFELHENDIDVVGESSPEVVELETMDNEKDFDLSENVTDVVSPEAIESKSMVTPECIETENNEPKELEIEIRDILKTIGPPTSVKFSNFSKLCLIFINSPTPSKSTTDLMCSQTSMTATDVKWIFIKLRQNFQPKKGQAVDVNAVYEVLKLIKTTKIKDGVSDCWLLL